MYCLTAKVRIISQISQKQWDIDRISSVRILRDTESLTDTCTLTLPRSIRWEGQKEVPFRPGDMVQVHLGYDGDTELAFRGYIRRIKRGNPMTLELEDEMYQMKKLSAVKKAYKSTTIRQLLEDQGTGCRLRVMGEQHLGRYRVTVQTVAELLSDLRKQGIRSFFCTESGSPVLYAGVLFDHPKRPTQVLRTGQNIVTDNTEQQRAEDMKLRVKVVAISPDNKKTEVELGDKGGELRTLTCYNKSKEEAKAWGEQEMKRLKRDGLTGKLTTFGYRLLDKLDTVGVVIDGQRMGIYQINKNTITFGTSGYRQEVELGRRVN